jgi:D-alanyl-D-alanine carboxypeptidase/D-alanyl-D-alanine-endopeptidase (penicillin-binding protein 4)
LIACAAIASSAARLRLNAAAALLAACAACCALEAARAQQDLPPEVAQALQEARIPASHVAAWVQDVEAPSPVVAHNARMPMNPASVMKLVTTYAGLRILGPTYTWKTQLLSMRPPQGGKLDGDLYLKGSGDPKLTLENFWLLLRSLRAAGVKDIQGDLVLDRSAFAAAEIDPARFDQEPLRPYNVGPDPLLINFKSVRFDFAPDTDQDAVLVSADPKLAQVELVSAVKLGSGECGDWRAQLHTDVQSSATSARVSFSGVLPASCGGHSLYLGLLSHPNYAYGIFRSLWEELGGTLRGSWRDGAAPPEAKELAAAESPPLAEVVRDINKFSNNVMARLLFLTLAREGSNAPARTDRAAAVVRDWLEHEGIALPELVLENGAGLSRVERVSAAGLSRLLLDAWASPVMPEFTASLPLVAYDGTMKRRHGLDSMAGQAHIKTGSLNDVRTVAGYVQGRNGHRYAVVFLVNHANAENSIAAQDAFLRWVHDKAGASDGRSATATRGSSAATRSNAPAAPAHH